MENGIHPPGDAGRLRHRTLCQEGRRDSACPLLRRIMYNVYCSSRKEEPMPANRARPALTEKDLEALRSTFLLTRATPPESGAANRRLYGTWVSLGLVELREGLLHLTPAGIAEVSRPRATPPPDTPPHVDVEPSRRSHTDVIAHEPTVYFTAHVPASLSVKRRLWGLSAVSSTGRWMYTNIAVPRTVAKDAESATAYGALLALSLHPPHTSTLITSCPTASEILTEWTRGTPRKPRSHDRIADILSNNKIDLPRTAKALQDTGAPTVRRPTPQEESTLGEAARTLASWASDPAQGPSTVPGTGELISDRAPDVVSGAALRVSGRR